MFKEFGAMMNLLRNQGQLQEELQKFQAKVGTISAEGTAGAGLVTAKANGRLEILSVRFSDEAMLLNDREMLEDLVVAATNQALAKVRELLAQESAQMAGNMGVPPGLMSGGFPGLS